MSFLRRGVKLLVGKSRIMRLIGADARLEISTHDTPRHVCQKRARNEMSDQLGHAVKLFGEAKGIRRCKGFPDSTTSNEGEENTCSDGRTDHSGNIGTHRVH